jgi:hypothetical protein
MRDGIVGECEAPHSPEERNVLPEQSICGVGRERRRLKRTSLAASLLRKEECVPGREA